MAGFSDLPGEIIEIIALTSASHWFSLVQVFPYLAEQSRSGEYQKELISRFLIKLTNTLVFEVVYHLPNRQYHNLGEPSITKISPTSYWYKFGKLHRDNDEPAIANKHGLNVWYKNGELHRLNDQPAKITEAGSRYWYEDGLLHRENDQPAIIFFFGPRIWYRRGKCTKSSESEK